MCLSLTPIGVCHAVDVVICPKLATEKQYLLHPLPGAPPYQCAHPCGGPCPFARPVAPPPPVPAMLMQSLRLASTLAGLVAASQRETEPVGTHAEAHLGPPAYGSLRYYRN